MKKFVSMLLALLMLIALLPMNAIAEEAEDLVPVPARVVSKRTDGLKAEPATKSIKAGGSGTCGDDLTWTLDDEGTLTISGTGAMANYSSSRAPWYSMRSSIKKIAICDSVTTIADYAFIGCDSLTEVTIGDSVTTIGEDAFLFCPSLKAFTVSADNPKYKDIDGVLFNKACTTLIQYPAGRTETTYTIGDSVTTIGDDAFEYCTSLTTVTIPDSVTTIGDSAFSHCTSLTEVTIGDSVTTIGEVAFGACASLTTVTIGDSVTTIGDMAFAWCDSLNTVIFEGEPPTSFGEDVFDDCGGRFTIYYYPKHESAWAPNGETTWNGYSIEPLDLILYGDVNLDGIVNAADATVVLRSVVGMNTLSETQLLAADVNYDGKVDAADAAMILRYVVGMVESIEP